MERLEQDAIRSISPVLTVCVFSLLTGDSLKLGKFLLKMFFNVYLFLRQRETEHEWRRGRERERERERERIPSKLHTTSVEPDVGLEPKNREIMT